MAKYSKKAQEKIGIVMHEFKEEPLESGKNVAIGRYTITGKQCSGYNIQKISGPTC